MFEQIPGNVAAYGKLVADSAVQANSLAAEGLARIARSQLKVIEGRLAAADAFWSEAARIRDAEGLRTIWPKSINLARETGETLYAMPVFVTTVCVPAPSLADGFVFEGSNARREDASSTQTLPSGDVIATVLPPYETFDPAGMLTLSTSETKAGSMRSRVPFLESVRKYAEPSCRTSRLLDAAVTAASSSSI